MLNKIKSYGIIALGILTSILFFWLKYERSENKKLNKENEEIKEANEVTNASIKQKESNIKSYRDTQDKINQIKPGKEEDINISNTDNITTGSNNY